MQPPFGEYVLFPTALSNSKKCGLWFKRFVLLPPENDPICFFGQKVVKIMRFDICNAGDLEGVFSLDANN